MSRDTKAADISAPGVPESVCKVYAQAAGTYKVPEEWRGYWCTFFGTAVIRFGDASVVVTPGAESTDNAGVLTENVATGVPFETRFDVRIPVRRSPDDDIWFAISEGFTAYRSNNP